MDVYILTSYSLQVHDIVSLTDYCYVFVLLSFTSRVLMHGQHYHEAFAYMYMIVHVLMTTSHK